MFHPRFRLAICSMLVSRSRRGQRAVYEQSPRQALIECCQRQAPFKKHLTLEMQSKLQNMMKARPIMHPAAAAISRCNSPGNSKMQSFDIGPICLPSIIRRT